MPRLWKPDGNHVDTTTERPADKAALEEWIREAWAKRAAMDAESFDQQRERARLSAEIDEYLEELMIHVLSGEMDAELA